MTPKGGESTHHPYVGLLWGSSLNPHILTIIMGTRYPSEASASESGGTPSSDDDVPCCSTTRLPPALQYALDPIVQEYALIKAQGFEKLHLTIAQRLEQYRFPTSGACNLDAVEDCAHHE